MPVAFFGIFFVIPSIIFLTYSIVNAFGGSFAKPEELYFPLLAVVIFITTIVMMRHWRLKMPVQKEDKFIAAGIVILGLIIPYIAGGIGAAIYGIKPWFYGLTITLVLLAALLNCVAVGTAWIMYYASRRFGSLLQYLPVICGYGSLAYMYLGVACNAFVGLAVLFIVFYSVVFFIGGYWLAWGIHCISGILRRIAKT